MAYSEIAAWGVVRVLLALGFVVLSCAAFGHGDLHEQIDIVSKQIARNRQEPNLYLKRGELHRLHQDWQGAFGDYDCAARLDPKLAIVDFLRGRALFESGRLEEAKQLLTLFLTREPKHIEALVTQGRIHAGLKDPKAAARYFTSAINASPQPSAELYFERARTLFAAQPSHYQEALRGLDEGIARLGPLVTLELEAIELELACKRYDAALARLALVANQSSRKERWLARRGEILQQAGRQPEAQESFQQALAAIQTLPAQHRNTRVMRELEADLGRRLSKPAIAVPPPT